MARRFVVSKQNWQEQVYVDDMVIKSPYEGMLLEEVEETLKNLERVRMKLNSGNCTFGVEEGQFLGYQFIMSPKRVSSLSRSRWMS